MSKMKVSPEEKKAEALKRLKLFNVRQEIIDAFEQEDQVMLIHPFFKSCIPLNGEIAEEVRKIEEEYNLKVYLVIEAHFLMMGRVYSMIYVSDNKEEWHYDREDIPEGYTMTYSLNAEYPECSEFGSIAYETVDGLPFRQH